MTGDGMMPRMPFGGTAAPGPFHDETGAGAVGAGVCAAVQSGAPGAAFAALAAASAPPAGAVPPLALGWAASGFAPDDGWFEVTQSGAPAGAGLAGLAPAAVGAEPGAPGAGAVPFFLLSSVSSVLMRCSMSWSFFATSSLAADGWPGAGVPGAAGVPSGVGVPGGVGAAGGADAAGGGLTSSWATAAPAPTIDAVASRTAKARPRGGVHKSHRGGPATRLSPGSKFTEPSRLDPNPSRCRHAQRVPHRPRASRTPICPSPYRPAVDRKNRKSSAHRQ
jgi:hypothetical protein